MHIVHHLHSFISYTSAPSNIAKCIYTHFIANCKLSDCHDCQSYRFYFFKFLNSDQNIHVALPRCWINIILLCFILYFYPYLTVYVAFGKLTLRPFFLCLHT